MTLHASVQITLDLQQCLHALNSMNQYDLDVMSCIGLIHQQQQQLTSKMVDLRSGLGPKCCRLLSQLFDTHFRSVSV